MKQQKGNFGNKQNQITQHPCVAHFIAKSLGNAEAQELRNKEI
jgi:hypothetical protein